MDKKEKAMQQDKKNKADEGGLGRILFMLLVAGAFVGIHLATRKSPYERQLDETATLIAQEAQRMQKPIDRAHVELALRRFNEPQLAVFNRYVKAVIHRDLAAFQAMQPEWKARIVPVLANAPEWQRYVGIIIGG
jgi:hypothetical protein